MDVAHRVVWRRVYGPIPNGPNGRTLEVDELCEISLCVRPDHLDLKTKSENVRRRGPTRGPNRKGGEYGCDTWLCGCRAYQSGS
jgi:hypothetical protein